MLCDILCAGRHGSQARLPSLPLPCPINWVGCPFFAMALQEPLGLENLQPPPLVAPPLVAGRENTWITVSHGSSTLPFVVSRPSADAGEANSIVLLLPGCGHFYVENMHPLPWQGAIEYLWSNLAFKKAVIACAWPVAGQAGSPPAWMLPDGAAWTKAVYTVEILPLLLAVQRDASPRISLHIYFMGLGSGGTITYQIAISEAHATFRACVCMGPIRLPSLLPAPTSGETRILVYGGRKDVETFQHHLRMCYSVRGNHRVPPVTEALSEDSHFTAFKGYGRTQYPWAPGLTIRQVVIGKDPEHVVWPALLSDPDWLLADHIELPE